MKLTDGQVLVERFDGAGIPDGGDSALFEAPEGDHRWRITLPPSVEPSDGDPAVRILGEELSDHGDRSADGAWAMVIGYEIPDAELEDLDDWYLEEHIAMLLECPDWLRTRRYEVSRSEGEAWNRVVVHDLASPDVLRAPEVIASMSTPWRRRLAERPWFLIGGRLPVRRIGAGR